MSIHQSIAQVFKNNIGNHITPELASGMIRSLIDILAAGVQQPQVDNLQQQAVAVDDLQAQEGDHGVV